jgi:hypothetical protein
MGLDMYLSKKKYVGWNYDHNRKDKHLPDLSAFGIDVTKVSEITEQVAYWRKANAIHKWFVDNVQDGDDDCGKESLVEKEDLEKLLELVIEVLDDPQDAPNILPAQSGFFFGNTDYDSWYLHDMEETKKILMGVLQDWDDDASYYYQSSW